MAGRSRPYFDAYRFRPFYRHGPYYGGHGPYYGRWHHGRRRWPWLQVPFAASGPIASSFVAWAQSALATVFGPAVPQDGVFGPETRGFVQRFQAQQGLPPTGDLDGATVAALQAAVSPEPASPPPPPPPAPPTFAAPPPMPPQDAQPALDVPLPPRDHRHAAPSQQGEVAAEPTEAPERGRWVREGGRIVLMMGA